MESENEIRKIVGKVAQAIAGFLCSYICILGYYPLLPAFYAAACLWKKRSFFLYAGMVVGIGFFMEYGEVAKYVMLIIVIGIAVHFYQWANKNCGGIAAGMIAGISTMAMNFSGTILSWQNRQGLLLGASEGILVLGFTGLIHYVLELFLNLHQISFGVSERGKYGKEPTTAGTKDSRMEALMTAVGGLAEIFSAHNTGKASGDRKDMSVEEEAVQKDLCAGCEGGVLCWRENSLEMNRAWYLRLQENRLVIAQQLDAMVELMKSWTMGERILDDRSRLVMARIMFEAKERGLLVRELHVLEDSHERRYIRAQVSSKWAGGIPSRNFRKALEKAMHCPMRLERNLQSVISQEWISVTAYEDTLFYTLPGIAMQKKDDSVITGDNFTMFDLDNGNHYIGLSDGMGSGSRANQESELVIELLEKLIRAGFEKEVAIKMMNSAMVLQGENQSFSTLDLAALDLYTGEFEILKIGAAASFLKHGDSVTCISAESLPAGADPNIEPKPVKHTAESGDFLVMVTDGVLEYFNIQNSQELFREMIGKIQTDNAGVLARMLLEQVLQYTGGNARDDMTILVTGIWEKA